MNLHLLGPVSYTHLDVYKRQDEDKLDEIYHLFSHYWDYDTIDEIVSEYESDLEDSDLNE